MKPFNVIDFVTVSPERIVTLVLLDDLDWEDADAHIRALEARLNAYLAFAENELADMPEVQRTLGTDTMTGVRIRIIARIPPPSEAAPFFAYIKESIEGARISFVHETQLEGEHRG